MLAEGTVHRPADLTQQAVTAAWLGPMVDDGFVQHGWTDHGGARLWLIVSAPDVACVHERLDDLPQVRDGSVSFTVRCVSALRFS